MNRQSIPRASQGTKIFAVALVLIALVGSVRVFWTPVLISGSSMEPAFSSGQVLWMRKNPSRELRRFDIVVAKTPWGVMTKRVLGLPGERLAMRDGVITIHGKVLDEEFPVRRGSWTLAEGTLRPGYYLLIGDNRALPERAVFIVERSQVMAGLDQFSAAQPRFLSPSRLLARTGTQPAP